MISEIPEVPKVPKEIIDAVNSETLAVFIGAGVSRLIGCMGWGQLAQNLVNRCFTTKKEDGSGLINFKEKETLIQNKDHKKTITICYYLLKENDFETVFRDELEKSLKANEELIKSQDIYKELYKLRGLFITTNIDEHFDGKFDPTRIVWREEDFHQPSKIDRPKLYHIHGSFKYKDSIIFTVPQYIKRYNNQTFKKFLEKIFEEYTVLFVGYGMAEFELLDFLITKFDSKKEKELKHFILLPFYRGEENILEIERYYYNSMGIEVIPYEKDKKGYGQLYEVIKSWNIEINQVSTYLYDTYNEIDDIVNNYSQEEAERIFQIIKNDEPQRNYFFKILASSTNPFPWLKPLKEKGYFDPQNNPPPQEVPDNKGYYTIPYWHVLGYLENVANKIKENPDTDIIETLLEIINQIISYQDKNGKRIENYRTDLVMIKIIFSLPIDKITESHIEFIKTALTSKWDTITILMASEIGNTILPKLLQEKAYKLVLNLLDIILSYKKIEEKLQFDNKKTYEYTSIMDEYWLKEALKKYKQKIAELCGIEAAKIAIAKIKTIVKEDNTQFNNIWIPTNNIWIPTIEDHSQITSPDRYECQLVHFVRDMFELSEPKEIKKEIKNLLKEEHPIFKRIAIHIINYHYKKLNDLFWKWEGNPLEDELLKHELYELFKNNSFVFTKEQINKVLNWIESKNYYISEDIKRDKEQVEKILAYQKKEWLSAFLESKNSEVQSLYENYNKINPAKLDHPGFVFWVENFTGYENPVAKDELLIKTNEEIAEYFKEIKEQEDTEGLSDLFRNCVSENPEKFTNNKKPYELIWELSKAWRMNKNINRYVVFISKILTSADFWNEEYQDSYYINRIISLIEEGIKDDNHVFSPKFLSEAEKILLILVEKAKSDLTTMNNLINSVLNSPKGKIFSAMVNYSLRHACLYKRDNEERWAERIKEEFTKRLNRDIESSFEFSVILGKYLPNLYWLDKKWVNDNINKIFPIDNDIHWKATFIGYLSTSLNIDYDIYFLLRENGHYAIAIKTEFNDTYIKEQLVQHICVGYLEDAEKLEDEESLISQLIENKNINQLLAIVKFFWMQRNKLTEKIKSKVKPLWKTLYELVRKNEENSEYQKLISNLSKWFSLVDEIDDEIYGWLKLSAKYIDKGFNSSFFIENLMKHVSKTPKRVGEIYLEVLGANIYPDFNQEHIQKIVSLLYNKQEKEIADKICNLYGEKGYFFLKEIYNEHNKKDNYNV
jgi:hypothetical protein